MPYGYQTSFIGRVVMLHGPIMVQTCSLELAMGLIPYHSYRVPSLGASQALVTNIMSPLGRGTLGQLVEEIVFLRS